jgi:DNA-binding NtrC family response regulator
VLSAEIVETSREMQRSQIADSQAAEEWRKEGESGGTLAGAVAELERSMIRDALLQSNGNISQAARLLGLTRKGLYLKMDRLNFEPRS